MSKIIKKIFNLFHNAFWLGLLIFFVFMNVISEDSDYNNEDNNIVLEDDDSNNLKKNKFNLDSISMNLRPEEEFKPDENCTPVNKEYRWKNLSWSYYKINFALCKEHVSSARENRNRSNDYGEVLYDQLYRYDSAYIAPVIETFKSLKEEKKLDRKQLLEAIVTFIQDIPYTYILGPGRTCGSSFSNSKGELIHYPKLKGERDPPPP